MNQESPKKPHVKLDNRHPGISGLLVMFSDTGRALSNLAEVLLRGPSSLSVGEREFLATYVSRRNNCTFCWMSHGAATIAHLNLSKEELLARLQQPEIFSEKIGCLAKIAEATRASVQVVPLELIEAARVAGADDLAIHHAALIASAFSMFNRYVESLNTDYPREFEHYIEMGKMLAQQGYNRAR